MPAEPDGLMALVYHPPVPFGNARSGVWEAVCNPAPAERAQL